MLSGDGSEQCSQLSWINLFDLKSSQRASCCEYGEIDVLAQLCMELQALTKLSCICCTHITHTKNLWVKVLREGDDCHMYRDTVVGCD
jgi:hypothetical protein